jgi:hypothetical protein
MDELRALRPDSPGVGIGDAIVALASGHRPAADDAPVLARYPELRDDLVGDPDLGPLAAGLG